MSYDQSADVPLTIAGELRNIEANSETVLDLLNEVGDDDTPQKRIVFGKRDLPPELADELRIARSKARNHEFHSIKAFCDYVQREAEVISSIGLADVEAEQILFSLDEGIGVDHEVVKFKATPHPLFAPWKALLNQPIPVLKFAMFVMQYRSVVIEPEGREMALMFSQIKASKTITKKSGIGAKTLNGVMIEMQIGTERKEHAMELPEQIMISAPLYLDTDPIEITFDVIVTEGGNGDIVVILSAPLIQEAAFNAFAGFVDRVGTDTGLLVGLGRIQEREWELLDVSGKRSR